MIIAIVGPTGVGKTKLSIALAKKYQGIIVNCDASQIYKNLDIGTAKVTEAEKENIEHLLFDIVDANTNYTVYNYQKDLRNILTKYADKNIIIVGGTGLYLKAGLFDYRFNEENENEKKDYSEYSNEELYRLAKLKDENMTIHPNNRQRLIRFLNKTSSIIVEPKLLYDNVKFIGLTTDRDKLYNLINKRVDKMFEDGLLDEVKNLYKKYPSSKALHTAIGYKELINYLEGNTTLNEAKDLIKLHSRHYAKRQYTWFKNQIPVTWFNVNYTDFNQTIEQVIQFIEK